MIFPFHRFCVNRNIFHDFFLPLCVCQMWRRRRRFIPFFIRIINLLKCSVDFIIISGNIKSFIKYYLNQSYCWEKKLWPVPYFRFFFYWRNFLFDIPFVWNIDGRWKNLWFDLSIIPSAAMCSFYNNEK